jgi:hypothetical protein
MRLELALRKHLLFYGKPVMSKMHANAIHLRRPLG